LPKKLKLYAFLYSSRVYSKLSKFNLPDFGSLENIFRVLQLYTVFEFDIFSVVAFLQGWAIAHLHIRSTHIFALFKSAIVRSPFLSFFSKERLFNGTFCCSF